MAYQKKMNIYCIHLFMSLFIIPSQSIIGKILPNLWQRRLEKPLKIEKKKHCILVAGEDHSDADCFVCAILSHGEEGYVYGTNGRVTIDSIVKNFKGDASPSLAGKPKIFFHSGKTSKTYKGVVLCHIGFAP